MNIFELVIHDPNHRTSSSLFSLQQNWCTFTSHLQSLQTATQSSLSLIISAGNNLWQNISLNTPNTTKMFKQHFIYYLKQLTKNTLSYKIQKIQSSLVTSQNKIIQIVNIIHLTFIIHAQYIQIIDDQNHAILNSFIQMIKKILQKLNFSNSLLQIFQHTLAKHCLKIFQQDIIDFDQNIKDYIVSTCQQKSSMFVQQNDLKTILFKLADMNLFEHYFVSIQLFMIKDCQNFLLNSSDLQSSSKFLTYTLNYHKIFQKSFVKKIWSNSTEQSLSQSINDIQQSIYFLCAKYCSKNILQIVLDYPDSHGVIIVLKKCLDKSNLLAELAEQLYIGVKKRLLIPGVITQNILNQYLNMLKVLQIIDPHGIVFEKITVPIKTYLLKRNDTLRCIISHMTENGEISSGLTRDMVRIPSKQYIDQESSDQNQKAAQQWQILNVKQSKMRIRVKYQQIDLATVLVNLYGSQQAFITEYQNMLAEKLMSAKSYNIEEQIKNIQLLKMRFGQNALQNCNVIVKDVKDSKKNDTVVHRQKGSAGNSQFSLEQMNCLAVSKGYWPINYDNTSTFELPQSLKSVFDQYAIAFSKIKAMRKIHYHNSLGHVNLTLSFNNGDFEFKCLPIHAVMINYFDQDKMKDAHNGISSQQLSANLHIQPNVIKQKMSFWVHKGVIKQIRQPRAGLSLKRLNSIQQVQTVYYKPVDQYIAAPRDQMQDDVDQFISKENTSMQSHLKHIIEGLILSILSINGPKSPQKIHLLLKTVYKTDLDYTYSQNNTIQILKKMVQKKKITFNGEIYSKIAK